MEEALPPINEETLETLGASFNYPRTTDGKIMLRGLASKVPSGEPKIGKRLPAIPEDAPGGLDRILRSLFGSREEGVRLIESLVASQGREADKRWVQLLLIWKHWNERVTEGEDIGRPLSLNQVCWELDIPISEFMTSITSGIMEMSRQNALFKAALATNEVIESAISASRDLEKGGKDRELLLRIAKVIDDKPGGVNVSVNQQLGMALNLKADDLKAPLRQFRETIIEIDNMARDDKVEDSVEKKENQDDPEKNSTI